MTVFDASALLAYLAGEPGAETVRSRLIEGGHCCAANWSEVTQTVLSTGANWGAARALLLSYSLAVEPVTIHDAELAAHMWSPGTTLSLADRLCLALGIRLDHDVLTADHAWNAASDRVVQIR